VGRRMRRGLVGHRHDTINGKRSLISTLRRPAAMV
jgi:hypothetical protein